MNESTALDPAAQSSQQAPVRIGEAAGDRIRAGDPGDPRFTMGLYFDVITILEKHGYVRAPSPSAHGGTLVELLHMVREFEGLPND